MVKNQPGHYLCITASRAKSRAKTISSSNGEKLRNLTDIFPNRPPPHHHNHHHRGWQLPPAVPITAFPPLANFFRDPFSLWVIRSSPQPSSGTNFFRSPEKTAPAPSTCSQNRALRQRISTEGYYRCSSSKGCSARKQVERAVRIKHAGYYVHRGAQPPWPAQRTPSPVPRGRSSVEEFVHFGQRTRSLTSTNMKEEQDDVTPTGSSIPVAIKEETRAVDPVHSPDRVLHEGFGGHRLEPDDFFANLQGLDVHEPSLTSLAIPDKVLWIPSARLVGVDGSDLGKW
ncbi:hypothetical protein HPP92_014335 [Vanilla planifolia]|uniref:WRKY domain-containing protein n=1 Tax=Vanilla planifolia TaxID=51239 RepID=A0A835UUE3_VANPL|nr:hypothetical protein HPP92_014742 [Vanilla planifolia]KAG0474649.1 hypothetical protein HPP92_014335 [Vanilla planifolia]